MSNVNGLKSINILQERARTELERAEVEANLGSKALETTCDKFESKKIADFKVS